MFGAVVMTFAETMKRLREEAGLSQPQLAAKSGVPVASIRGQEQGRRLPSWPALVKLARALGVSTDAFADCDEVKPDEPEAPKRRGKK